MALIATDPSCKLSASAATCSRLGGRRDCIPTKVNSFRNSKMQPTETEFSTDGLPKAFLHSLRTLFDILDDGKRGFIHISEIESRWQGADTQDLPGGVLECLRRVAPPHGCLSFERFVAGLRHSMLNPHNDQLKPQSVVHQHQVHSHCAGMKLAPPQSHQGPTQKHSGAVPSNSLGSWGVENKVRPLGPSNGTNAHHNRTTSHQNRPRPHEDLTCGYPASSKSGELLLYTSSSTTAPGGPVRYTNAGYERTGRSLERVPNLPESSSYRTDAARAAKQPNSHQNRVRSIESLALESPQLQKPSVGEGGGLPRSQSETTTGLAATRRHGRSRDEQRRHTITNGVDYGMVGKHAVRTDTIPPPSPTLATGPHGNEPGPAQGPRSKGFSWPAQPKLDNCLGSLHYCLRPLEQQSVQQQGSAFFPVVELVKGKLSMQQDLKQMKELEQEKDSLLAGLDVVERAREWYQNQIHNVTERQRTMGQSSQCADLFPESSQTRLNVLLPKLQEVNRCLSDLISCSGMAFTASGNLPSTVSAIPQPAAPPAPPQAIQRLKDQNRLLTQEVTEKSERITQLEQEKSALIKQLFEARARSTHDNSALDSTFI
ncbi:hypothetical protein JZ751_011985 [Albula glossodonta]|uniref:Suppressor APC domain-containing protein n=1 Tax=Albula glossodonta TaxID=121402 RepID=A0A8T2PRE6_9TELE|nr:hypothetical protein JZ751_011985 [Albula glossodonta]